MKKVSFLRVSSAALLSSLMVTSCSESAETTAASAETTTPAVEAVSETVIETPAEIVAEAAPAETAAEAAPAETVAEAAPAETVAEADAILDTPVENNAVAVQINGKDAILVSDIDRAAMNFVVSQGLSPEQAGSLVPQIRSQIREDLITQRILKDAMEKNPPAPATEEERKECLSAMLRGTEATVEEVAKMNGVTVDEVNQKIDEMVALNKFLSVATNGIASVTVEEAKAKWDELAKADPNFGKEPETVTASHILLRIEKDASDEDKAKVKAELEDIRKQILDGASFEELAKTKSACPSGARSGGSLGAFGRGQMVPEFEKAAFEQEIGVVGPVVETSFGYHIIKVTDRKQAVTHTFEEPEVQQRIMQIMNSMKKQEAVQKFIENLRKEADVKIVEAEVVSPAVEVPAPAGAEEELPAWAAE